LAGFRGFLVHRNTYGETVLQCTKRIAAMRNFRLHRSLGPSYLPCRSDGLERCNGIRTERATTMNNRLVNGYRNWRKYRDTYNELMRLTQRDLDDLGINRVDIPAIARQSTKL
jgi:uncharacterized protein YjiS (DUF1127 family)